MLPLWFLLLALLLPRLSLAILWINNQLPPVPMPPIVEGICWLILPRFLIAFIIYVHMGTNLWFWIHAILAVVMAVGLGVKRYRN